MTRIRFMKDDDAHTSDEDDIENEYVSQVRDTYSLNKNDDADNDDDAEES